MDKTEKMEKKEKKRNSAPAKTTPPTGALCENMNYGVREAFKRLRTNVDLAFQGDSGCKIIGITSAQVNEGKSTVSVNLAYTLAEAGKRVLLIDCDLRRPTVHSKLNSPQAPGLTELLTTASQVGPSVYRYKTEGDNVRFDYIPSGEIPKNPSELLSSQRFAEIVRTLGTACDYIIMDLPPVGAVIDAVAVSQVTDGMVVVIRENRCPRFVLEECMDQLTYAKARILGFVMNGVVEGSSKRYYYKGHSSHYDYRYGSRDGNHYGHY